MCQIGYWLNAGSHQGQVSSVSATFTRRTSLQSLNLAGKNWCADGAMDRCFDCYSKRDKLDKVEKLCIEMYCQWPLLTKYWIKNHRNLITYGVCSRNTI